MTDGIWVLTDDDSAAAGDLQLYAGRKKITPEKLAEFLDDFTGSLSTALERAQSSAGSFNLAEVTISASLSGEYGFTLVAKAGVEAGISLKFVKETK